MILYLEIRTLVESFLHCECIQMLRVLSLSGSKVFPSLILLPLEKRFHFPNRLSRLLEEIMSDDKENKVRQCYLIPIHLYMYQVMIFNLLWKDL